MNKHKVDAVTVEIVGNLLLTIAEEIGISIIKSAYSSNIKERRDISAAVFDPEGNLVAQAEHVPMHLGSLLSIVKEVYNKYPPEAIQRGDMFIGNDPYNGGGTHLPDITIVAPVFAGERLIGWVANLAHHSDVGGKVPGSTSGDAVSIYQEGIKIPISKICRQDEVNEEIVDFIMTNSRIPEERYGDLHAQMASNRVGVRRLLEAYEQYGETLVLSMAQLQNYAERRLRAGIEKLQDGEYSFTDYMDDAGAASPDPIKLTVKITIQGDAMELDFAGSQPQVNGPINVTYNGLLATVFYSIKALIDPDIYSNAGIYRAFTIKAEPGLIINARNPAPVGARIDTCMRVSDVIFGAMAPLVPDRAIAGCNSSCTTAVFSGYDPRDPDQFYVYLETIAGGSGASRRADGLNGVQVHLTNTSNLPIEALEMEFPLVIVREYSLIEDSGGAGEYRGGLGIRREFESRFDQVTFTGLGDRQKFLPWGLNGGGEGAGGVYQLKRADNSVERLPSKCTEIVLNRGDRIVIHTPGAGGYGNPADRDPSLVLKDVIEKKISIRQAKEKYGLPIIQTPQGYQIAQQ
ncbi:hydantoinase B/oxoprolinase family protein [Paenibacillus riograndensis]|uniref:Hydantoinase B/oxoprolinase domain-containing protein n=1 Tax=Paenibacillus riograndensis SBR5 TaxID=1073571 RepID=A0A0E3WIG2_9BACL|nr:hydantoinase B/oxoprolinase family protein [Paenibacillus riograndensis]CQR56983.1 hypothetical protein PRIO_4581 [Paenibacillus riograndensis SBR5]